MNLPQYIAHCWHETKDVATSDPRLCYGLMGLISFILIVILAGPEEQANRPGFAILKSWGFTDFRMMVILALHFVGMMRAIFKLKERPELDWWATVLGFLIFGMSAVTIDLSLGRVTFQSGMSAGIACLACWLMFAPIRKVAGTSVVLHETIEGDRAEPT